MRTAKFLAICLLFSTCTVAVAVQASERGLESCVASPTVKCLVDNATAEMEELGAEAFIRDSQSSDLLAIWHEDVAELYLHLNDLRAAAEAATGMRPLELISLIEGELLLRRPTSSELEPLRDWAVSILETPLENPGSMPSHEHETVGMFEFFEYKSHAARVLQLVGEPEKAISHHRSTVDEFGAALAQGETNFFVGPSYMVETAAKLGDIELARRVVELLEANGADEDDLDQPKRQLARAEEAIRAEAATLSKQLPSGLTSAMVWASQGEAEKLVEYVRGLPEGNTLDSRDVQIMLLVGKLLELEAPEIAEKLVGEVGLPWIREDLMMELAAYYAKIGDPEAVDRILYQVSDFGMRARILIDQAEAALMHGEAATAAVLVGSARAALENETDPARLAILGLEIAYLFSELGDRDASLRSTEAALPHIKQIDYLAWEIRMEAVELAIMVRILQGKSDGAFDLIGLLDEDYNGTVSPFWQLQIVRQLAERGNDAVSLVLATSTLASAWEEGPPTGYDRISLLTASAKALAGLR